MQQFHEEPDLEDEQRWQIRHWSYATAMERFSWQAMTGMKMRFKRRN
jgi:hypothetical protein